MAFDKDSGKRYYINGSVIGRESVKIVVPSWFPIRTGSNCIDKREVVKANS